MYEQLLQSVKSEKGNFTKKLGKIETKKDETQKKLNVEQKEKEMFGLKLE